VIGKLLKDQAGTFSVGLGQVAPGDLFAKPQVVRLIAMRVQHKHQIPQAVTVGKLAEHHAQQLIPASEMLNIPVATVLLGDRVKNTAWKKFRQLCENVLALIHVNRFLRLT